MGKDWGAALPSSLRVAGNLDPTTAADRRAITDLLDTKPTTKDAEAAKIFFSKHPSAPAVLQNIAHAEKFEKDVYRRSEGESSLEAAYFKGMGKKNAVAARRWVEANLSESTNKWLGVVLRDNDRALAAITRGDMRDAETILARDVEDSFKLPSDAVVNLDMPVHPAVTASLYAGDLTGALSALAKTASGDRVAQIAKSLIKVAGTTKVEVVKNLKGADGTSVAGLFDPKTNTIKIDAGTGINAHTILHETTHATVSATLDNKNHPLTKQLTKLYEEVKDSLSTYYGSESVDEFASEAFGNSEFQRELARIYPTGAPISALTRFFNTIGNFVRRKLGMQTRPLGSALNNTDTLIEAMLAPAPDSRDAGEMYLSTSGAIDGMIDGVKSRVKSATRDKPTFVENVVEFIQKAPAAANFTLLYTLPLQAVRDIAGKYKMEVPARELQKVIEEQAGLLSKADERVDGTLITFTKWVKNHPTLKETFDSVVYRSTVARVDPSKNKDTYKDDPEKLEAWESMQEDWKKLRGSGGQAIYKEMRDAYKAIYEDMRETIDGTIDSLVSDPEQRKKLKASVLSGMFNKNTIDPYFPLTREGKYWIRYEAKVGETTEVVYEALMTMDKRKARIAELKNDSRVVVDPIPYDTIKELTIKGAPSNEFMEDVLQILKPPKGGTKEEEALLETEYAEKREQLMQLYLQALPETAVTRAMQGRGDVAGFDQDAFGAFRDKAYNLNRKVAQLKSSKAIIAAERKLEEAWNRNKETGVYNESELAASKQVLETLKERANFARNPPTDLVNRAAAQANRLAFMGTIGFNISSAIVNASQVPLIFMPMLNGKYRKALGGSAASKAIWSATAVIGSSGTTRKLSRVDQEKDNVDANGTPSIDNYYEYNNKGEFVLRKDTNLDADKVKLLERLKPLVEKAGSRGLLSRSLFYDTLNIDDTTGRDRSLWDTANGWGAFAFHSIERYNRQVALISSYDLELQRMQKEGTTIDAAAMERAAEEAIYMTTEMNGGASLTTTGQIAQTGIGRVAWMYKSYGTQMYYTLFKTGAIALNNMKTSNKHTPEEIRIAREQFFGVLLSSALLAGVQGMPLVGAALMLANLFLDEDEDDAETILRKHIGELAYKGPVNALTGTDVASRIGLSNLLYRDNPYNTDASDADKILEIMGGPAWSIATQFKRGLTEVMSEDGDTMRGVEGMLPAAFRNVAKGIPGIGRYAREDGILTRRGDPIVEDVTTGGLLAQMLGFPPTEYTLKQEQSQASKRIDRTTNKKRTKLLRRLYVDIRMGSGSEDVMAEIRKFNARHPNAAIGYDSVKKSLKGHMRTSALMVNGVTLSKNYRQLALDSISEYDRGF